VAAPVRTHGILSATQRHKDCYKTQRGKLIGDCRSEQLRQTTAILRFQRVAQIVVYKAKSSTLVKSIETRFFENVPPPLATLKPRRPGSWVPRLWCSQLVPAQAQSPRWCLVAESRTTDWPSQSSSRSAGSVSSLQHVWHLFKILTWRYAFSLCSVANFRWRQCRLGNFSLWLRLYWLSMVAWRSHPSSPFHSATMTDLIWPRPAGMKVSMTSC